MKIHRPKKTCLHAYISIFLAVLLSITLAQTVAAQTSNTLQTAIQPNVVCSEGALGQGLTIHVYIEQSDFAQSADPLAKNRRRILHLLADTLFVDSYIRDVQHRLSFHTYDGMGPKSNRNYIYNVDNNQSHIRQIHTGIENFTFNAPVIVQDHITLLFDNGIAPVLQSESDRPIVILVLNEMRANSSGETKDNEFAIKARSRWNEAIGKREPEAVAAIYMIDFGENEPGDAYVINAWKDQFFTRTSSDNEDVVGGYRTINRHNALSEIIQIVQESAARTASSTTEQQLPIFNQLTATTAPISVCPFSTVRYAVLAEQEIKTIGVGSLFPSNVTDRGVGRYVELGQIPTNSGQFIPQPNTGFGIPEDQDVFYIFRALGGIQKITCPSPLMFDYQTPTLSIDPALSDNLTLKWGPVGDQKPLPPSSTGNTPLPVNAPVEEDVEYQLTIERSNPGDRFICPPTRVLPKPTIQIKPVEEIVGGQPITWAVTVSSTAPISAMPTVSLIPFSLSPSDLITQTQAISSTNSLQPGTGKVWTFVSESVADCVQWMAKAELSGRNHFGLDVNISDTYPFYTCPDPSHKLFATLAITDSQTTTNPISGTLPLIWPPDGNFMPALVITSTEPYVAYQLEFAPVLVPNLNFGIQRVPLIIALITALLSTIVFIGRFGGEGRVTETLHRLYTKVMRIRENGQFAMADNPATARDNVTKFISLSLTALTLSAILSVFGGDLWLNVFIVGMFLFTSASFIVRILFYFRGWLDAIDVIVGLLIPIIISIVVIFLEPLKIYGQVIDWFSQSPVRFIVTGSAILVMLLVSFLWEGNYSERDSHET